LDAVTHSILPFVGILLGLIVIHEAGHYITAKIFGVKVLEAGIGFPPRVWGFRWRDTDYTLNALPLGAFVRLLGEEDPSDPASLAAQPKWKRTVIIGAGAAMNLVLAIALFSAALMVPHKVSIGGAQIGEVAPNSPAQNADLRAGDQIVTVNGRKVENQQDASYFLRLSQGSNIDLTVKRQDPGSGGSKLVDKSVYSRWNPGSYTDECGIEHTQGPIGITVGPAHTYNVTRTAEERATLETQAKKDFASYKNDIAPGSPASCYAGTGFGFRALSAAVCGGLGPEDRAAAEALKAELFTGTESPCYTFSPPPAFEVPSESRIEPPWRALPNGARMSVESLILFRNQVWGWIRGFVDPQLAGPVGIAQTTGEVVHQAGWQSLINFAALLSMNLAVINILPIPMVDGGRLLFIFIEFIRRGRRIAPQKEALVHLVGFVAMIMFAAVLTYFDVARIVNGDNLLR
jgi:regulator of sigma E protease